MCKVNYALSVKRIMPQRATARARNGGNYSIIVQIIPEHRWHLGLDLVDNGSLEPIAVD